MIDLLKSYRPHIEKRLNEYLASSAGDINHWSQDVRQRVLEYTLRGKMIRGALVFGGADAATFRTGGSISAAEHQALADTAAAMELIQSFLLIHDDIMDDDDVRRGMPAVHAQYRSRAVADGWDSPERSAIALGICAGDIAGFWAMQLLSRLALPPERLQSVIRIAADEIVVVGMAQMQDVAHGVQPQEPSTEDILGVYRCKTGRYTFALPMMLGWVIAGGSDADIDLLGQLGEAMGIVFQIQDDYIGLFGDPDTTGKPNTSDITENKKTLYRQGLRQHALQGNKRAAAALTGFGQPGITTGDVHEIQSVLQDLGVVEQVAAVRKSYVTECEQLIARLYDSGEGQESLLSLVRYLGSRGK
ncbi:polyprenyl synthetase family protein [Spirochaeta africana]|uniref:Geranylgeranyl pyrophosphate synthase n=1 Tax=Spirochaeta africana (strain ATCC 700263 / DSM 8902 / Z-7692) TaxID=889378 RepID=H9UJM5_SPIAZ|nr:polyprenyl synthetase family protein [Spirochaeta africana]AFG37718.1 geranylgeranyl pyrophosphate synthase [Spirochaeta africana DSM 8902]